MPSSIRSTIAILDAGATENIAINVVLALVGQNGAGKTTIVKLLARLYDPTEGRVLLDGRDLRDYDLAQLRARRRDLPRFRPVPPDRHREDRRRARRRSR